MIPYIPQPTLSLGPLSLHAFGVLVAIGVLLGTRVVERRVQREGLDVGIAARLAVWVLVAGFIGAHLVDRFIYYPQKTLADPVSILRIWEGISSFGGFLGAIVGAALFIRFNSLGKDTWRYLDAMAYAFPTGWFFGRMGCFFAHDHPGSKTDFFLAVKYPEGSRHNLGLDEALYTAVLIGIFYVLGKKSRPPGYFCAVLAILYAPVRFFLDFLRTVDVRYFGLTPGQYGSIALFIVGIFLLIWSERSSAQPATSGSSPVTAP